MPWKGFVAMNLLPYLNLAATMLTIVAEIIKSYVRHANTNGSDHG